MTHFHGPDPCGDEGCPLCYPDTEMRSNVVSLCAARTARSALQATRVAEDWASLLLGELGPQEIEILETMPDDELETFFRLRKTMREQVAISLVDKVPA